MVARTTSFSSLKPLPEGKDGRPFYHSDALVFAFFNYSLKNASPLSPKTGHWNWGQVHGLQRTGAEKEVIVGYMFSA